MGLLEAIKGDWNRSVAKGKEMFGLDDGFQVGDVANLVASNVMSPGLTPGLNPLNPIDPVKVSTGLGQAQRTAYTYGVSRPLTTFMLATMDPFDTANELDRNASNLRNSWNASEYVSPGQEIVAGFNNYFGRDAAITDPDAAEAATTARGQVNRAIINREKLDASQGGAFKNNPWANIVSGSSDAAFNFWLDPGVVVGKGAAITRASQIDRIATPKRIPKLQQEIADGTGGMGRLMDEFESMDRLTDFAEHRFVRDSADPDALARSLWLAGESAPVFGSTKRAEQAKILRAAFGDQGAADELRATRGALSDMMEIARSVSGAAPPAQATVLDDYRKIDAYLDAALGRVDNAGVVNSKIGRSSTSRISAVEANRAKRAGMFGEDAVRVQTFQKAAGFRPIHVVERAAQTRPQGVVRLSGPSATDGYTELQSQLARAKGLTPERRTELLESWAAAPNLPARKAAVEAIDREAAEAVVMEFGFSPEQANDYVTRLFNARQQAVEGFKQSNYLEDVDGLLGDPGGIVYDAQFVSQLSDSVPLLDLDHLRAVVPLSAEGKAVASASRVAHAEGKAVARVGYDLVNAGIDTFWRPLILLRGGYAPRNIAEAWGRMAGLGVLGRVAREQGVDGVANWFANRAAGVKYAGVRAVKSGDDAAVGEAKRRVRDARMSSKGTRERKGVVYDDAFEGRGGAAAMEQASEGTTIRRQLRPDERPEAGNSTWVRQERPTDPDVDATEYWESYTRVVNQHFATDPVTRLLLQGKSRAEVKSWLRQGSQHGLRAEKGMTRGSVDQHVDLVANYMDELVPPELWDDVLAGGLSRQEYATRLKDIDTAPVAAEKIIGDMTGSTRRTALGLWNTSVRGLFKYVGQKPTDTLVRNPYFADKYRRYMDAYVDVARQNGDDVTEDMIRGWEAQARKGALRDLKNDIYTIERYSNVSMALRPAAPFIAATNNTVLTWARIIGKNPQTIPRISMVWNAPVRTGAVLDLETFQPVDPNSTIPISSKYGVAIPLPGKVKEWAGLPEGYKLVPPLASFNVALQSDPWWLPGWGPMVTVPFAYWANRQPDNQVVKWIDGFVFPSDGGTKDGRIPNNPLTAALPAWIRQTLNKNDPDGTQRNGVMATMIAQERQKAIETGDYSLFQDQDKFFETINARVDAYFTLRALGAGSLPFAANVQDPEAQFYVAASRRLNQEGIVEGKTPDERFLEQYGEAFFGYTFSVTRNNAGVAADSAVQARLDRLDEGTRAALADQNPFLLGVLVNNPDGSYNFSSAAFNKQRGDKISVKNNDPMRQVQSGFEAYDQTQAGLGWDTYIKARTQLEAFMAQNGITSLQSAPGLQAQWQQYVTQLEGYFPAWKQDRDQRDDGRYERNVVGFDRLLDSTEFAQRPEAAAVQSYLDARQQLAEYLASGNAPAKTLRAQANAGLRDQWEAYVRQLVASDTRFSDLYFRFFDGEFGFIEEGSE